MGEASSLPALEEAQFCHRLRRYLDRCPTCPREAEFCGALHRHYEELRRWSRSVSLVGPGTAAAVVERHYGESLAAYELIGDVRQNLVDVGSGAGFPGMVLAAACPQLAVTLVEPRERKWHFLKSAARRSELCCRCLNARVGRSLPAGLPGRIDLVTCRALALSPRFFDLFLSHSPGVRFLLWRGSEPPPPLADLEMRREIRLPDSRQRRILEIAGAASRADPLGGAGTRENTVERRRR